LYLFPDIPSGLGKSDVDERPAGDQEEDTERGHFFGFDSDFVGERSAAIASRTSSSFFSEPSSIRATISDTSLSDAI
jgi:hypothetical protein